MLIESLNVEKSLIFWQIVNLFMRGLQNYSQLYLQIRNQLRGMGIPSIYFYHVFDSIIMNSTFTYLSLDENLNIKDFPIILSF